MEPIILSGIEPSQVILDSIQSDVKALNPKLVIIQVGNDAASDSYIRKKLDSAASVGMRAELVSFRENVTESELFAEIKALNSDGDVTGYIIQLPLPEHIEKVEPQLFREIDPYKDVDGFTAYNIGKMFLSTEFEHLPPATPAGVISLLEYYDIPVKSKKITVVGHSSIVGKPIAVMLMNRGATVTVCHEFTKNLKEHTLNADIIISAVGKPNLITGEMIGESAVLIDIGITQTLNGLKGDFSKDAQEKSAAFTPVPGGVGPMTVACLLRNCVTAKRRQMEQSTQI